MNNEIKNILISGWYGYGNIGDEAILQAIIDENNKKYPNANISVLSFIPEYNKKHHTKNSYFQIPISGLRSWLAFFIKFRFVKTLYQFYKCDLFIMGGGGFLSDWQPEVPYGWLKQMKIAKIFNCKTRLYGIGAGPFNTKEGKDTVKKYIDNYVDKITVRDSYSYKYLVNICNVSKEKVCIKVDPVANLDCTKYISNESDGSISLIYTPHFDRKIWKDKRSKWVELKECYFEQVKFLLKNNEKVKLVFFQKNVEIELANDFVNEFGDQIDIHFPEDFKTAINILSKSKAIVSFRLHGNILAHAMNIPYLPIIYHHKAKGFIDIVKYKNSDIAIEVGEGINWYDKRISKSEWISKTNEFINRLKCEKNTIS